MAQYRVPELDLSSRTALALEMLKPFPERSWGWVSESAKNYGVSRTSLYEIRDRALEGIHQALAPREPGPPAPAQTLIIDKPFIQRAITVFPMVTSSVRGIQLGLELLFGVGRSTGYISQTLQVAGEGAAKHNAQVTIPIPVLGEADEIFQGRQPCLTMVDGRSFLVLHLSPAQTRDATSWGLAFLDVQERGIQFQDLASDGARGIQAGVREAELAIPLRPDLFHLMREVHPITRRLARQAYQAMDVAERARVAEREAQAPKRRRGRPLQVKVPLGEAVAQEEGAILTHDLWVWLIGEVRQALEPISGEGRVVAVAEARATLQTAVELLLTFKEAAVVDFAHKLQERMEDLLSPLAWLERSLSPWRKEVDAATESFIVWCWQHREVLDLKTGEGIGDVLQPVVRAYWEVLSLFHRSSSLAEALHSWLRPHLQIHRGMPRWLLPLLQYFWNHHPFQRGKRAGQSPLQLAGRADAPSLSEALDRLFHPVPTAQPAT